MYKDVGTLEQNDVTDVPKDEHDIATNTTWVH